MDIDDRTQWRGLSYGDEGRRYEPFGYGDRNEPIGMRYPHERFGFGYPTPWMTARWPLLRSATSTVRPRATWSRVAMVFASTAG